jgi:uncharacterized membrane protein
MSKNGSKNELGLSKWSSKGITKDRLTFFSDAVFAIAITLLALDIRIVDISRELVSSQLTSRLIELIPNIVGYIISFWIIANFWIKYHWIMSLIKECDRIIILMNLVFLMFIAILPFPTSLLGKYPDQQLVIIFYSVIIFFTGSIPALLWVYASKGHKFIEKTLTKRFINQVNISSLLAPAIFLIAIPFSHISPYLSMFVWSLALPFESFLELNSKKNKKRK